LLGISFKLDEVSGKTILRFSKKLYKDGFIKFLKDKNDFEFLEKNRMNYVFKYHGDVGNAELYFKAHLTTYYNLNNKLNLKNLK